MPQRIANFTDFSAAGIAFDDDRIAVPVGYFIQLVIVKIQYRPFIIFNPNFISVGNTPQIFPLFVEIFFCFRYGGYVSVAVIFRAIFLARDKRNFIPVLIDVQIPHIVRITCRRIRNGIYILLNIQLPSPAGSKRRSNMAAARFNIFVFAVQIIVDVRNIHRQPQTFVEVSVLMYKPVMPRPQIQHMRSRAFDIVYLILFAFQTAVRNICYRQHY